MPLSTARRGFFQQPVRAEIGYNRGSMTEKISAQKPVRLEELMKQRFTPEGKAERVARALAALHQEEPIKLSPEDWKWVADGANVEDLS